MRGASWSSACRGAAPVLKRGVFARGQTIGAGLAPPLYRTPRWREALMEAAEESGSRPDMVRAQSDMSDLAEGLYVRIEAQDIVRERYKFVRGDALQTIQGSDSHWHDRPILPNRLAEGIDIFAPETGVPGAYDDPGALQERPAGR